MTNGLFSFLYGSERGAVDWGAWGLFPLFHGSRGVGVLVNLGCYNKLPSTRCLNNRYLFLTISEAGDSDVRVPAWRGSGKAPLRGLYMASHGAEQGEKKDAVSCLFLRGHQSRPEGTTLLT